MSTDDDKGLLANNGDAYDSGAAIGVAPLAARAERTDDKGAGTAAGVSGGSGAGGTADKLVPGWGATGDNQIVIIGVAVLGLMGLFAVWNSWRGGDGDTPDAGSITNAIAGTDSVEAPNAEVDLTGPGLALVSSTYGINASSSDGVALLVGEVDSSETREAAGAEALKVPGIVEVDNRLTVADNDQTEETQEPTADLAPLVESAVSAYSISSSVNGDTAVLVGTVPTEADSAAAAASALAVEGIESVDNRLTAIEPGVLAALVGAGTAEAGVAMDDRVAIASGVVDNQTDHDLAISAAEAVPGVSSVTDELIIIQPSLDEVMAAGNGQGLSGSAAGQKVTLTGVLDSEEDRVQLVESAQTIEGVTEVIDQMTVDTTVVDLNALFELEPIQFATASSVILEESFGTLNSAAEILSNVTDRQFEVQGYTDVRGPEAANLALSQARADSVLAFLETNGVDPSVLTSVGYGETIEFGEGDSPEALSLNRRVQFAER